MSQTEESESDNSFFISKKEIKIHFPKILDLSPIKDNRSESHIAKIKYNPLAKVKVLKSNRVLDYRKRFNSSTCRISDKPS